MATTTSAVSNPNKPTAKDLFRKAITGIDKYFPAGTSLRLMGVTFTPDTLKAVFQADIDATNNAEAGHAQWRQQVAEQKATRVGTRAARKALKSYLLGVYAGPTAVGVLQDFGFTVPKTPGRKTVASKSQGVAKAKATRAARHTMGTKQRKLIKGAPEATGGTAAGTPAPAPTPTAPAKPAAT